MPKYRVMWAKPAPLRLEVYEDGLGREEAWDICKELLENGCSDVRVEEMTGSEASSWVARECKFSSG